MNNLAAQQISLNPAVVGEYYYYYDPTSGTLYRYRYNPLLGVYSLVSTTSWVPAPMGTINVEYGDILRITAAFTYRGPAFSGILYGTIGWKHLLTFDEVIAETNTFTLLETPSPLPKTAMVDVPVTTALVAGNIYSICAKIMDANGHDIVISDYYEYAIYVVEEVPIFADFSITDYGVV